MKKVRKHYYPPQVAVIELKKNPYLLAGSNGGGELPINPNIPI